jgi:hypothetical protein
MRAAQERKSENREQSHFRIYSVDVGRQAYLPVSYLVCPAPIPLFYTILLYLSTKL